LWLLPALFTNIASPVRQLRFSTNITIATTTTTIASPHLVALLNPAGVLIIPVIRRHPSNASVPPKSTQAWVPGTLRRLQSPRKLQEQANFDQLPSSRDLMTKLAKQIRRGHLQKNRKNIFKPDQKRPAKKKITG
jgi:hypothetical protein